MNIKFLSSVRLTYKTEAHSTQDERPIGLEPADIPGNDVPLCAPVTWKAVQQSREHRRGPEYPILQRIHWGKGLENAWSKYEPR